MKKVVLATVLSLSAVSANAATPTQIGEALLCAGSYQHMSNLAAAGGLNEESANFTEAKNVLGIWSFRQLTSMGLDSTVSSAFVTTHIQKGDNLAREQLSDGSSIETIHQICTPSLTRAYASR